MKTPPSIPPASDGLFSEIIRTMARGRALGEISTALREVVEAVKATGKAGSMNLKLTVNPAGDEVVTVNVAYEIVQKLPKRPLPASLYFTGEDGELTRTDPRQLEFPAPAVIAGGIVTSQPQNADGRKPAAN